MSKLQMTASGLTQDDIYCSCTHVATVGVKGLNCGERRDQTGGGAGGLLALSNIKAQESSCFANDAPGPGDAGGERPLDSNTIYTIK